MPDEIIDPLSDGNANGSDDSRQNEENAVTDGPQIGQPGAAETVGVKQTCPTVELRSTTLNVLYVLKVVESAPTPSAISPL